MSSERTDRRRPTAGPHGFVGVTYGEFQSLYHYGRGRISGDRVVRLKMNDNGTPAAGTKSAKKKVADLLERVPQLMLDDQEGILILELEPRQVVSKGEKVIEVRIGDVRNVIPTTRRAKRILEPRMRSIGVALDRPRFEDPVLEQWSRRNVDNAIDGGRALCRLLFGDDRCADETGAGEASGDDGGRQLQDAVEAAIRQLDRQEGQDVDQDGAVMAATWIPAAYRFTRHDPYDYGFIDYLIDSGQVLKKLSWPEQSDGVEWCREVVRGVLDRRSSISSLADVVGDAKVASLAAALEETAPGLFPAGFRSLVIFCRWKELFHGWREAVDLQALGKEARELVAGGIDFRSVRESLWLLGCFAGHERVAPMRYAAEDHSWWCGEKLSPAKITGPATGTVREGEVSGAGGEPAAAATNLRTIGDGAVSGEAQDRGAVAEPETVVAGALSGEAGEQAGEAEKQPLMTAELVAVQDGELPGEGGEPSAAAEETGKGPGRLPLEPPE
ncbi:MAG: hypothetical protein F4137_24485 [Acidobacteria bacterium]|nr:hypothetical protein [Acidobacteriota bacterium]